MELRPNQTGVDAASEEWNASVLGVVSEIQAGINKPLSEMGSGALYVTVQDLYGGTSIPVDGLSRIKVSRKEIQGTQLIAGDIVFGKSSVKREGIGYPSQFLGAAEPVVHSGFTYRARARSHCCDATFLFYQLRAERCRRWLIDNSQASALTNINARIANSIPIALPSLPEQRAIAAALSDVDALLGAVDRLIAKKRDLKQAAMQQLLTGETRLPGYTETWRAKQLGELADIVSGGTPRTAEPSYWDGDIRWCTPTDITACRDKYLTHTAHTITPAGLDSSGARLMPAGALLLCSRATVGEVRIAAAEMCTNQGFKSLVCKAGADNEFLYYKLLTMKQSMVERAFGSTFLEISKANVAALCVDTPPIVEQRAIAAVLSDMDAELSALGARRDKTRALKQAMMQELLTGRTRLV